MLVISTRSHGHHHSHCKQTLSPKSPLPHLPPHSPHHPCIRQAHCSIPHHHTHHLDSPHSTRPPLRCDNRLLSLWTFSRHKSVCTSASHEMDLTVRNSGKWSEFKFRFAGMVASFPAKYWTLWQNVTRDSFNVCEYFLKHRVEIILPIYTGHWFLQPAVPRNKCLELNWRGVFHGIAWRSQ